MFTFPDAVSRVVFQYPTSRQTRFVNQVLGFVGGKEQRYGISGLPLRQWDIQPAFLGDAVWADLAAFFELVGGTANPFAFTDPWEGTTYPVCYFGSDTFTGEMREQGRTSVQFTIQQGRVQS
jgi:hypothetical protein